jgi:hydroxymethylpyrimidine kinase/phosphomethylpyrimidine kinase
MKTLLIIAGSDPGAGAGLQQDLKTATLLGVYGLTVVTALTVQNTRGLWSVHPVAPELVAAQLDAVLQDFPIDAVKIGMVGSGANAAVVAARLRDLPELPLMVLDPVLAAGQGGALLPDADLEALTIGLFPLATLLTPNVPEAARLTGLAIDTPAALEDAARRLAARGPRWVLAKGGHLPGPPVDILTDGRNAHHLEGKRLPAPNHHGSGCLLATALAAHLARGLAVPEAVNEARRLVVQALRHGLPLGGGPGPVNPYAPFARELGRYQVLTELAAAGERLVREDLSPLIPEVMSNLAYAAPYPEGPEDVAAFPARILKTPGGTLIPAAPAFGAVPELAALLLTVMAHHPTRRAAIRVKCYPDIGRIAPLLHWRALEVPSSPPAPGAEPDAAPLQAMAQALAPRTPTEPPPDILYFQGDKGKAAVMYILGENPVQAAERALALKQALRAAGH